MTARGALLLWCTYAAPRRYKEASLRQHGIAALKGRDREAAQVGWLADGVDVCC